MKLFVVSDIHGETRYFEAAAGLIKAADLVVVSGDITRTGDCKSAEGMLSCIEHYTNKIIAVHGNWDRDEVRALLEERGYGIHGRGRIIDGIGFFGVGGSNQTPMNTVSEYTEEEISQVLSAGNRDIAGAVKMVLVSHVPPRRVRDRTFIGFRGGGRAIREFLDGNAIDLCLTGHIHEAFGGERLHNCIVVNSGSFKKGRYSLANIHDSITADEGK